MIGDYVLGKKLGAGQFSKVKVGTKEARDYAVKYMPRTNDLLRNKTCLDLVINEAKVMLQLDHANIVKLFEFSESGLLKKANGKEVAILYLVLELITGGEMFDYIAVSGRFMEGTCRFYAKQLVEALEYLYAKGYAHRDIKPENILLDDKCNLKLADFGFATAMAGKDGTGKLHSQKGTLGYMAPELNSGQPYSGEKVDLFAVGVLLFIMTAQHPPFRKASIQDPFYKLFCTQNDLFWTKMSANKPPGTFSPEFKLLVNSLLAVDPGRRPTIAELKAHPWFAGPIPTLEAVQADFAGRRSKVEVEWKAKAQEAAQKRRLKKEQELKKKAGFGAFSPHIATKGGAPTAEQAATAMTRFLPEYKVLSILAIFPSRRSTSKPPCTPSKSPVTS